MRRLLRMILTIMLLLPAARADETWTEETAWGDTITYTQTDVDWGYILYSVTDDWMVNFRYGDCIFAPCDDFVSVHNEMTGLQTFYRDEGWGSLFEPEEVAAWAEKLLQNGEVAFVLDVNQGILILPGIGEVKMPDALPCDIRDAYIRNQRLFMTLDTFDNRHFLRIVTWRDGIDVLDIAMPWSGSFDAFHVGAQVDDYFILHLDTPNPDFGYIIACEAEDGCWLLSTINTGREVIDVEDWGVRCDVNMYWAYGACPWRDLATMDWMTLPLTYMDAAEGMAHEGWRFAAEGAQLFAAMDGSTDALMDIPADTPLCLISVEGDWAFVGVQKTFEGEADFYDGPWVGYVPVAMLNELPVSLLPGGEVAGWFVTMTVETTEYRNYYGRVSYEYNLTFAPIDGCFDFIRIEVNEGFAEAALEAYRETGYAATPVQFAEELLPYLNFLTSRDIVADAVMSEKMLSLSVYREGEGVWELVLVTRDAEGKQQWTNFRMPGPFRFSRAQIGDWDYAIEFVGE